MKIEFDEECPDCKSTGLYVGIAEKSGAAAICHTCKGTGKHHFKHTYEKFVERKNKSGITRVFQVNPGICIGGKNLEQFGGMSYKDWKAGNPFPPGSEMRAFTCPAWWYQSADCDKKPDWKDCVGVGSFSGCGNFNNKQNCWERWDEEFVTKKTNKKEK